jgi:hypothetical protein
MRRRGTVLPMLLCVGLSGCFAGENVRAPGWLERVWGPQLPLGPDSVLIDMMVVEQRLGDRFLNDDVWDCAYCQAVGLERQGLLADNGLRVGPVIGMVPGKLHNLLSMERYCAGKRRQILGAGHNTTVALGSLLPAFNFCLHTDAGATDVVLEQGQAMLLIEPSLTDDGRTRLKFTPQVTYGSVMPDYQADQLGWQLEFKRPSKTYPALGWEVTLAPNQYLIVGTHFDENASDEAPPTLGGQFFVQDTDQGSVQRLLVIRTMRGQSPSSGEWRVAKSSAADAGGQEKSPESAGEMQSVSPAAHCLASP